MVERNARGGGVANEELPSANTRWTLLGGGGQRGGIEPGAKTGWIRHSLRTCWVRCSLSLSLPLTQRATHAGDGSVRSSMTGKRYPLVEIVDISICERSSPRAPAGPTIFHGFLVANSIFRCLYCAFLF